ncbi:hypothetical protein CS063_04295 [Sporanaerobium hydrogeniformans]|uniref:Uncharacterized protein n=1 Tax=Sporanaerobium hydrogeniformans TaxID=3072179 RepID=A0AC61DG34_9FIRM|nr:bifunctional oligoribonuclease/PAP phosphatase NrnA [Sporanaerobium hydrogeniformans]PHV71783.1 hypothetical protein CS063_04295 [Sporanaerobium hydrogeniformans]
MIEKIIGVLKNAQHILIATHMSPDGDAIGSSVAMAHLCQYYDVPYTLLLEELPTEYAFLLEKVSISKEWEKPVDVFLSLDCGDTKRLGNYEKLFEKAKVTINIDHHVTNEGLGNYAFIQAEASSTSELVYKIIKEAGMPITAQVAESLYTGLVTDTGGFMHSCTHSSTHLAVADLLQTPFNFTTLYYKLIHEKTEATVRLQSRAIQQLIKWGQGQIYVSYLTPENLKEEGATREDASHIVTYLKNIKGCEVAIVIYPGKIEGEYKVSLRSNPPYDVAAIAKCLGGGGHERAAGASIIGTLEEVFIVLKDHMNF